ncbi:MAG: L-aspartate oxidase [Nitrospirae bacterium]|nr:L-aspartate oxidase [Nitrospirota bacterium]MBF0591875.1 L-aspartate oxidase [Nitrospirota bacterium]
MQVVEVDYLVIGSGVAGLRAAIGLACGGSVYVITKDEVRESSTEYAQGGIAVALSDEDTIGIHFDDTIKAGDGLCDEEAVRVLVNEGPERIMELISWGAEFDKSGSRLAFTMEAAHSRRRILHAHGDSTGREVERVLITKARSMPAISKYSFAFVLDLIVIDGRCYGAYVLRDAHVEAVLARATVLATGGAGQVYLRTTNPAVTTGDGIAVAHRAGAVITNMEFVQFHPTSLFAPSAPQFLLSEALRGEGAILRNIHKDEFMLSYHPDGELAARDIVSRAIVAEMQRTNARHVYLDITHLEAEYVKCRFPRIYRTCLKYDIDITTELIPVSPAAHYLMGGVRTDTLGCTSISGLFAAGEVACTGVHGANRLASNSLLEGLVFGARAAMTALDVSDHRAEVRPSDLTLSLYREQELKTIEYADEIRQAIRKSMWEKAGIIRSEQSLSTALDALKKWSHVLEDTYATRYDNEIKNMLQVACLIVEAALHRQDSVGAHYRSDYPLKK